MSASEMKKTAKKLFKKFWHDFCLVTSLIPTNAPQSQSKDSKAN